LREEYYPTLYALSFDELLETTITQVINSEFKKDKSIPSHFREFIVNNPEYNLVVKNIILDSIMTKINQVVATLREQKKDFCADKISLVDNEKVGTHITSKIANLNDNGSFETVFKAKIDSDQNPIFKELLKAKISDNIRFNISILSFPDAVLGYLEMYFGVKKLIEILQTYTTRFFYSKLKLALSTKIPGLVETQRPASYKPEYLIGIVDSQGLNIAKYFKLNVEELFVQTLITDIDSYMDSGVESPSTRMVETNVNNPKKIESKIANIENLEEKYLNIIAPDPVLLESYIKLISSLTTSFGPHHKKQYGAIARQRYDSKFEVETNLNLYIRSLKLGEDLEIRKAVDEFINLIKSKPNLYSIEFQFWIESQLEHVIQDEVIKYQTNLASDSAFKLYFASVRQIPQ